MHLSTIPRLSATGDSPFLVFFFSCILYNRKPRGIVVSITLIYV